MEDKEQFNPEQYKQALITLFDKSIKEESNYIRAKNIVLNNIPNSWCPQFSPCLSCQHSIWNVKDKEVIVDKKISKEKFLECYCKNEFKTSYSTNISNSKNDIFIPVCSGNPDFKEPVEEVVEVEILEEEWNETEEERNRRIKNEEEIRAMSNNFFNQGE